jgi:hypothetical protein
VLTIREGVTCSHELGGYLERERLVALQIGIFVICPDIEDGSTVTVRGRAAIGRGTWVHAGVRPLDEGSLVG